MQIVVVQLVLGQISEAKKGKKAEQARRAWLAGIFWTGPLGILVSGKSGGNILCMVAAQLRLHTAAAAIFIQTRSTDDSDSVRFVPT